MDLDIDVKNEGSTCVMSVAGEVDVYTSPKLKERLTEVILDGCYDIVIDMSDVDFIDSSGLGALVSGLRRAKENGGSVKLASIKEPILKVFRITGLDNVFPILPSVEEARRVEK